MKERNDPEKLRQIAEYLKTTPEALERSFDKRRDRSKVPQTRSPISAENVKEFKENIAEMDKAETRAEKKFVKVQQALRSRLKNQITFSVDENGAKAFFKILPNHIVQHFTIDSVVAFAMKELKSSNVIVSNRELKEHVLTWSDMADPLPHFPSTFEIGGNELTFNRLNLSLAEGPTSTWDYFIAKCGANAEALMAFIWSLLDKNCKSQQFLLIKGSGRDGKGSLTRWLDKLHGGQTVGLDAFDKYWPAMCVGKRIGVFSDVTMTSVVMSSAFKQITGGDKISIQQKFEKAFSFRLDTKFILTTNRSVNIINDEAERRRAILVEVSPDKVVIENYEEKLDAETSAFLFKCKQAHGRLYDPIKKEIKCDYEFFNAEASSYEDQNDYLFNRCFSLDPKAIVTASDFYGQLQKEVGMDNIKIGSFKEWLFRAHGIKRKKVTLTGQRKEGYEGIRLKSR